MLLPFFEQVYFLDLGGCLGIYVTHGSHSKMGMRLHIYRYHCSEEHLWLREYLTLHPNLLQGAFKGEVFDVAGIKS